MRPLTPRFGSPGWAESRQRGWAQSLGWPWERGPSLRRCHGNGLPQWRARVPVRARRWRPAGGGRLERAGGRGRRASGPALGAPSRLRPPRARPAAPTLESLGRAPSPPTPGPPRPRESPGARRGCQAGPALSLETRRLPAKVPARRCVPGNAGPRPSPAPPRPRGWELSGGASGARLRPRTPRAPSLRARTAPPSPSRHLAPPQPCSPRRPGGSADCALPALRPRWRQSH